MASLAEGTTLTHYRALAAIVEPSPYSMVNLDDGEMSKYLRVLEEAHSHSAVLPAPPGTVFKSQGTLTRWLELHYFTLTEALSVIEGHAAARVSITTLGKPDETDTQKSFAALAAESLRLLRSQAAATVTLPPMRSIDSRDLPTTPSWWTSGCPTPMACRCSRKP